MIDQPLPERVRIREVGPRDGFQNEPETIATADKIRLIDALARTGLEYIEAASFVRADVIPQLSDAVAALEAGVTSFESSFGELGGCPVPPGSTGNIASEDLVSMFHEMGVQTGIDLDALIGASRAVQELLGRPLTSHVLVAGPVEWQRA
jgi:hydroxymethylglutaryl-CoA lyase